jgi:hypothetical protein
MKLQVSLLLIALILVSAPLGVASPVQTATVPAVEYCSLVTSRKLTTASRFASAANTRSRETTIRLSPMRCV